MRIESSTEMEQLRRDEYERHGDGGDQLRAEVISRGLHARQQGDDDTGQHSEQEGAP